MHALIIEDEPLIAMVIEDVLRDIGYTSFDIAASSKEAVAAAAGKCPDLITSDGIIAGSNGIDAIETICGTSRVPVVFITGNPSDVQARLPAYPVIPKPFTPEQVAAAVQLAARGLARAS